MTAAPEINRRRLLLGLAAASSAAAVGVGTAEAAPTASTENPELLTLIAALSAVAAAFHEANHEYREMEARWNAATPWAPDELTVPGTNWSGENQPGSVELLALGGSLLRAGDDFPRRIVVGRWDSYHKLLAARRALRKAKKAGSVADCLFYESEVKRLKALDQKVDAYFTKHAEVRRLAKADHERLSKPMYAAKDALEKHIANIMDAPDWTMEGLVIKAQALAEWDRVGSGWFDRVAIKHGQNWHGQIAASIMRHAQGGEA